MVAVFVGAAFICMLGMPSAVAPPTAKHADVFRPADSQRRRHTESALRNRSSEGPGSMPGLAARAVRKADRMWRQPSPADWPAAEDCMRIPEDAKFLYPILIHGPGNQVRSVAGARPRPFSLTLAARSSTASRTPSSWPR